MPNNIQEKLQQLFIEYTDSLPDKLKSLEAHWQSLRNDWNQKKLTNFIREVHSLSGSSATYGYKALSSVARDLELYLNIVEEKDAPITAAEEQDILNLLNKLFQSHNISKEVASFPSAASSDPLGLNKLVYVLDQDDSFFHDLLSHVQVSGYKLKQFKDFNELLELTQKEHPLAHIIDIEMLSAEDAQTLKETRKANGNILPLICTSTKGDLTYRLKAVRAGCTAFFLKIVETPQINKLLDSISDSASDSYRILIIDDSAPLAQYYSLILEQAGMVTAIITNPLDIMKMLVEFQPDLLLMDIYMPECSGLELAAMLRQQPLYAKLPIIFLSIEDDPFKQLFAMSIGGDDFLTKPILPQHLIAAVKSRARRAGVLSSYMTRDSLTDLFNHTTLMDHLALEMDRSARVQNNLSFVIIDVDCFKAVNDTYEYTMGDYVIRKLGELLTNQLRKTDLVGRYGGDEFAVILPDTNAEDTIRILNTIREKFSHLMFSSNGAEFTASFSAGVASFPQYKDLDSLVAAADQALYRAKHNGRDQVEGA